MEHKLMDLSQFKSEKIKGRENIRQTAIEALKGLNPVALHQFGSGGRESSDEFSDLDFFATLKDEDFEQKVKIRKEIYSGVAPILIRLYGKVANPVGWYHDLIIYDTDKGLYHVDFYLTPRSKVILPPHSKLIEGEDLPVGTFETWTVEDKSNNSGHDLYEAILAMSYIGVKGVARKWGPQFFDYLRSLYNSYRRDENPTISELPEVNDFNLIRTILDNLQEAGNAAQQKANDKIRQHLSQVEKLYK